LSAQEEPDREAAPSFGTMTPTIPSLLPGLASAIIYYTMLAPHTVLMISPLFSRNYFRIRTMEENEVICDRATALAILRAAIAAEHAPRSRQRERLPIAEKMKQKRSAPRRIQSNVRYPGPCRCGLCHTCIEYARWERVFNEKFVDAQYYGGLRLSHRSPLAGL